MLSLKKLNPVRTDAFLWDKLINSVRFLKAEFEFSSSDQPKIRRPPSSVTKIEKESVTLNCEYEGKPMPSVDWLFNGSKLEINSNSRFTVSQSGDVTSATSSLTITNLNRTDEGSYTCVISNSVKSNVAAAAQLTVDCKYISIKP